jgi:acyl carrier protein
MIEEAGTVSDQAQVAARVSRLLSQVLDVPEASVGPDFTSSSSPAWTSLNHLMLISQLENEFGVVFSNQEIRQLTSFTAIVDTLGRRLGSVA